MNTQEGEIRNPVSLASIVDQSISRFYLAMDAYNDEGRPVDITEAADSVVRQEMREGLRSLEILEIVVKQTSLVPSDLVCGGVDLHEDEWDDVVVSLITEIVAEEMIVKDPLIEEYENRLFGCPPKVLPFPVTISR